MSFIIIVVPLHDPTPSPVSADLPLLQKGLEETDRDILSRPHNRRPERALCRFPVKGDGIVLFHVVSYTLEVWDNKPR